MIGVRISKHTAFLASVLAGATPLVVGISPLQAQEVVQALPARESGQLNAALRKLATRPTDLDALLSAGNASLALRDPNAASGFFTRASRVAPADSRVLLGLARVALEQRRPVDALQGFAQAETAGVRPLDMAADRALAYDLVGDNAAAQALYRSVLAVGDSAEVRRRLALSLAITGNRAEFERTLYPLLRDEDRSAFRTRAFGLAILGLPDDAVGIADAMMSTDLALRMAPYLRYMPRLTKSQQAAAGNLGVFPAAAEIGRDSPDIAGYAGAGARIAANANTALTPTGAPLGPRTVSRAATQQPTASMAPLRERSRVATQALTEPTRRRPGREPETVAAVARAPTRTIAPTETPAATPVRVTKAEMPAVRSVPVSTPAPAPVVTQPVAERPNPVVVASIAPATLEQATRPSLKDAFADFGTAPSGSTTPAVGAVDISSLAAARKAAPPAAKAAAKPEAKVVAAVKPKPEAKKPAKPAEPAREWVQVGVGRNTSAFGFDWKKLAKQAGGALDGKGPWAVKYGATNRMLAGPFPNDAAAKAALKRLKDKDIDALPYSSAEGEKVTKVG